MKRILPVVVALGAISLALVGAQQLPPGQIRPRPAEGREPEFPQPKIREYHPRSTLVVPQHPVPRAKFPVIDFHHHPPFSMTVDARLQKSFTVNGHRVSAFVDAYNVFNQALEVEEFSVTGATSRVTAAVQPPRVFHIGVRIPF